MGGRQPKGLGDFSKAVVEAVILFGLEMWVLTPCIGRALVSFHHSSAQSIMDRQTNWWEDGGWE